MSYAPGFTRERSTLQDIINDDIPPVVRLAAQQSSPYLNQYQDIYSPQLHQVPSEPKKPSIISDDLTFRMRPNTESVVTRDYRRYQPTWSWTDFTSQSRQGL